MRHLIVALLALLPLASPAAAQRLAGTVVPSRYTLWFAPDLTRNDFRGRESIQVQIETATTAITLHAADIEIGEVTIAAAGITQTARVTLDAASETATLSVGRSIPAGPATIQIAYTGRLHDTLHGFYVSQANERKYAVTQMEPTDARRVFPSFDEPIYKATFEMSLMVDSGDTVISNGRQVSDTPGPEPGKHTVTFAPTAKMSTYLVAMFVGDFVCRGGGAAAVAVRVCSTPDKRDLTGFALETAEQQLRFYSEYTGIGYPFDKLDIIAVPDFSAGAMENAGAIAFRERLLLIDAGRASLGALKNVAGTLSHEIAHMWFGNLVTMTWWDDIWLNEGFATWMENKPLAASHPEWRVDLDDAQGTQGALAFDALRSTRPIRTSVETPDEINEVFDSIAYGKTAAVLRMLESFVGPEAFRRAVSSYLTRYSYSNATGEEFWNEVARVTGTPVDRIMQSFVEQPGAPVVSLRSTCSNDATTISLRQERFVGTPDAAPLPPQSWTFPVCVTPLPGGREQCQIVDRPELTFSLAGCASSTFGNAGSRGYYFFDYDPASAAAVARMAPRSLTPVERVGVLGNEWWMVRGGRHDIGVYLDLAAALALDETAAVASSIADRLSFAGEYVVAPAQRAGYQAWIRERFGPGLTALGLPGNGQDDDERQSRRATLLTLVGVEGNDTSIQALARRLASKYVADGSSISGTLAPTVLRVGAVAGDVTLYDQYVGRLHEMGADPEEYYRFFGALSWFRDPALIARTLDFAISPGVRTQDTGALITGLLGHPWSRDAAWEFAKAHWPALTAKVGGFQGIGTIVRGLGAYCSPERAAELKQFFAEHPVPSAERTLRQSIERIESCAAFVRRQSPAATDWLQSAR